jgi:hypothetical protein
MIQSAARQGAPDLGFVRDFRARGQDDAPPAGTEIGKHTGDTPDHFDGLPLDHGRGPFRVITHDGIAPVKENGWVAQNVLCHGLGSLCILE